MMEKISNVFNLPSKMVLPSITNIYLLQSLHLKASSSPSFAYFSLSLSFNLLKVSRFRAMEVLSDNKENIPPFPTKSTNQSAAMVLTSLNKKRRIREPLEDITHLFYPSVRRCKPVLDRDLLFSRPDFVSIANARKRRTGEDGFNSLQRTRWGSLRKDFR
ncbi:hypothetical protein NE237_031972 [Protea cynaroides]|uniref:Uncharacterized protein n=1 Tax=Protea cynaroides TaxID=273540 RepID=A0A9Q0R338_9MAGN|nr:hypothetical protein NE237_031972 [Protea cynaroides]